MQKDSKSFKNFCYLCKKFKRTNIISTVVDMKLPELYKEYYCYDDGKYNLGRQYKVLIFRIVDLSKETDEFIEKCLRKAKEDEAFDDPQKFLVFGISYEREYPMVEIFAHDYNETGWFGLGEYNELFKILTDTAHEEWNNYWCCGRLDIDGTITKQIEEYIKKYGDDTEKARIYPESK